MANENLHIARNRVGAPGSQEREAILEEINARKAAIASTKFEIIAKEKELKAAEKVVKEIVRGRDAKPLQKKVEAILGKYKIVLTKYHGGSLIGNDCQRLLANSDAILNDVYEVISNPEHRRDDVQENINSEIRKLVSDLKELMLLLDIACSMMASQEKGNYLIIIMTNLSYIISICILSTLKMKCPKMT